MELRSRDLSPAWRQAVAGCRDRDDLAARLAGAVVAGRLPSGVTVPKQRALAEWSGLARETVRQALLQLAKMGLLGSRGRHHLLLAPTAAPVEPGSVLLLSRLAFASIGAHHLPGSEYAVGVELRRLLAQRGVALAEASADGLTPAAAAMVLAARPAAVVLIDWAEESGVGAGLLAQLARSGTPVLSTNSTSAPAHGDAVDSDQRAAGRLQAEAAAGLGAEGVLRLWLAYPDQAQHWLPARNAGVVAAARRLRLKLPPPVLLRMDTEDALGGRGDLMAWAVAGALTSHLAGGSPARWAVLLSSDHCGVEVAEGLLRLGLDPMPGGRPFLIGCDAGPPQRCSAGPWTPAITLDRRPAARAALLADLVQRRLRTPDAPPRRLRVAPQLCPPPAGPIATANPCAPPALLADGGRPTSTGRARLVW